MNLLKVIDYIVKSTGYVFKNLKSNVRTIVGRGSPLSEQFNRKQKPNHRRGQNKKKTNKQNKRKRNKTRNKHNIE